MMSETKPKPLENKSLAHVLRRSWVFIVLMLIGLMLINAAFDGPFLAGVAGAVVGAAVYLSFVFFATALESSKQRSSDS